MSKGQKTFYKVMHGLSILFIILGLIAAGFFIVIKLTNAADMIYSLVIGPLSITFTEGVTQGFSFTYLDLILLLVYIAIFLIMFWNVQVFFKHLKDEMLFIMENARAIRNVAFCVIFLAFFNHVPFYSLLNKLLPYLDTNQVEISLQISFDFGLLFTGLAILAVYQIFKEAVRIKEENDLTI